MRSNYERSNSKRNYLRTRNERPRNLTGLRDFVPGIGVSLEEISLGSGINDPRLIIEKL